MLFGLMLLAAMHVYEEWTRRGRPPLRLPAPVAGAAYAAWIIALVVLSPAITNQFFFFQL